MLGNRSSRAAAALTPWCNTTWLCGVVVMERTRRSRRSRRSQGDGDDDTRGESRGRSSISRVKWVVVGMCLGLAVFALASTFGFQPASSSGFRSVNPRSSLTSCTTQLGSCKSEFQVRQLCAFVCRDALVLVGAHICHSPSLIILQGYVQQATAVVEQCNANVRVMNQQAEQLGAALQDCRSDDGATVAPAATAAVPTPPPCPAAEVAPPKIGEGCVRGYRARACVCVCGWIWLLCSCRYTLRLFVPTWQWNALWNGGWRFLLHRKHGSYLVSPLFPEGWII